MDPRWLIRNLATAWRYSGSVRDFVLAMLWIYSASKRFSGLADGREWLIGFRYAPPIGRLRLLLRSDGGSDGFIHGEVFHHEYYSLPLASPPMTILDLGANIGLASVYFSRRYPEALLAFVEPMPDNLRVLARNLELNGIEATVFPAAVDVEDGRQQMEITGMDYGHKIADATLTRCEGSLEVAALSVSTILRRLGWERVGLLKVDIEGHEKNLFSGDCNWLNSVDAMCIECHGRFGVGDLRDLAGRFGFGPPTPLPGIWLMTRAAGG